MQTELAYESCHEKHLFKSTIKLMYMSAIEFERKYVEERSALVIPPNDRAVTICDLSLDATCQISSIKKLYSSVLDLQHLR